MPAYIGTHTGASNPSGVFRFDWTTASVGSDTSAVTGVVHETYRGTILLDATESDLDRDGDGVYRERCSWRHAVVPSPPGSVRRNA